MSALTIRAYRKEDAPALATLWHASRAATGLDVEHQPSPGDYRRRLDGDGRGWSIRLAMAGPELCGFLAFQRPERWLRQLFIAPSRQRQGIGRLLLEVAKQEMPSGFWLGTDETNIAAQLFYERLGLLRGPAMSHPTRGHRVATYRWSPFPLTPAPSRETKAP